MKKYKIIILSALLLTFFTLKAQITIQSSDMPSANDTIRYSAVQLATGVDFKTTGANKTWDFSQLKPASQGLYEYKNSSSTPYILNFGFSALGLKVADSLGSGQMGLTNVFNFFRKTTGKWENVGIGFQLSALPLPQAGKHTNPDEIYQFPLNYQDQDSSSFALKLPLTAAIVNVGNYFQDGKRVNTVDGWGKISTPYKKDIACLRIKSVITQTDSIAIALPGQQPINFSFPNNRTEYKWLSNQEKIPVLEVTGTELGGRFTPTLIRYRDQPAPAQSGSVIHPDPNAQFSVYPNPATDHVTIRHSLPASENSRMFIIRNDGTLVKDLILVDSCTEFKISALPSGNYQLMFLTGNQLYHKSLTINR